MWINQNQQFRVVRYVGGQSVRIYNRVGNRLGCPGGQDSKELNPETLGEKRDAPNPARTILVLRAWMLHRLRSWRFSPNEDQRDQFQFESESLKRDIIAYHGGQISAPTKGGPLPLLGHRKAHAYLREWAPHVVSHVCDVEAKTHPFGSLAKS